MVGLFFSQYKAIKTTFTCSACGDGVSPSFAVISPLLIPSTLQKKVASFARECLTEPIKSSLFYRRGLIELARLSSLALRLFYTLYAPLL